MNNYIIYCTPEQTKKALELGAPLEDGELSRCSIFVGWQPYEKEYEIPTAEEMIGWLEEQKYIREIYVHKNPYDVWFYSIINLQEVDISSDNVVFFRTRKEATIAAIDAALEYLTNKNE